MVSTVDLNTVAGLSELEAIAKIGNSGNTSGSHLHIHARKANTGKSILDGEGLPITFNGKFLVRNSLLISK